MNHQPGRPPGHTRPEPDTSWVDTTPEHVRKHLEGVGAGHLAAPSQHCRRCGEQYRDARAQAVGQEPDGVCYDCEQAGYATVRAQAQAARTIAQVVPPEFEGKGFDAFHCPPGDVDALRLVDGWRPGDRGLYLWSEATGCGKSHLVYALVQRELHAGRRVVALEWTDFLSRVKATFNRKAGGQTEADVDAEVEHADLLVIDDLGAGRPTEWSTEKLWSLVNARYLAKRALIVTSNYDPGMLRRVLGAPEGARIGSRLDAMCRAVRVRGADMRGAETAERVRWQARGEGT